MTTLATYHDVQLTIPDGWTDASTITLFGPAAPEVKLPLMKQPASPFAPSVILRRSPVELYDADLDAFADNQREILAAGAEVKVVERSSTQLTVGGEQVRAVIQELVIVYPDHPLRQLHIYFKAWDRLHALIGTAPIDAPFDGLRKTFVEIAESLHPVA